MSEFADHGIYLPRLDRDEIRMSCPQCSKHDRDRTLGVNVPGEYWHCYRCEWKGSLRNGADRNIIPLEPKRQERTAEKKRAAIQRVLSESHSMGEPVMQYLKNRLGHVPMPAPRLGCHPNLPYYDSLTCSQRGRYPAMVASVVDVDGQVVSVHRTYLQDGQKAPVYSPRKLMSPPPPLTVTGCAIRLHPATEALVLAEGIETALALTAALDQPSWACISAHGLKKIILPESIRTVIIGADNDESGVGQAAAMSLQQRLRGEGRKVSLMIPPEPGDWLDEYLKSDSLSLGQADKTTTQQSTITQGDPQ